MGTEIDRLEVQVEAQATKASAQLDILVKKLNRVSASLSGVNSRGLATMGAGVNKLANAMSNFASNTKTTDFSRLSRNIKLLNDVDVSGLSSLSSSMKELASGLREISTVSFSAEGLNSIVSSLGRLGGVKATVGTQNLQSIKDDLTEFVRGMNGIGSLTFDVSSLSALLNNISKLGGASMQKAITNLPALATAMNDLMTTLSKAPQVSNNIIQMTNALANLAAQGSRVGTASNSLVRGLNNSGNAAAKATKKTMSLAAALGKIYLVIRGAKKLWTSIESSMDYVEVLNYFDAAFGQVAESAVAQLGDAGSDSAQAYYESFASRAKELTSKMTGFNINDDGTLTATGNASLGINPSQLMQYQATFAQMSSSMGVASETSLKLSQALTTIGADLASVKNMDFDQVWNDMASGLAGMSRTLDKYGANIRNVNLQQELTELGIDANVAALNQNDKALLRAIILLDSTKYAWGDLADTLEQPANQLRLLESNFSNLSRTIGNLFLPVVSKVLPYVNGLVIAVQRLFSWIGNLLGIDLSGITSAIGSSDFDFSDLLEDTDDLTGSLGDAADAANKLKHGLQSFDELNVITTSDSSDSGADITSGLTSGLLDAAFDSAFSEYQAAWDEAFANIENQAQDFADKVEGYLQPVRDIIEDFAIGDFFKAGQDTSNLVSGIFNFFADAIDNVDWKKIGNNIGDYLAGMDWAAIMGSVGNVAWEALKAAIELWSGMFEEAPVKTLLITFGTIGFKLGYLKLTKGLFLKTLGDVLGLKATAAEGLSFSISATLIISWALKNLLNDENSFIRKFLDENAYSEEDRETYKEFDNFTWAENIKKNFEEIKQGWAGLLDLSVFDADIKYISDGLTTFKNTFNYTMANTFGEWAGVTIPEAADAIVSWFDDVSTWFSEERWKELGQNMKIGLSEEWTEFTNWWENTGIPNWWDNSVIPWTTKEKWMSLGENIKGGLSDKWEEFTGWWQSTGLYNWWKYDVEPFFDKEAWSWSGIGDGLSEAWNSAIEAIKNLWNNFADWLNDKLTINIDTNSIIGKGISEIMGTSTLSLGVIPTFSIGGFPEDGLFMANHNELVGQFSNGKTAVANNEQIIAGIEEAAYRGMMRALAESGGSNVTIHVEGDPNGMFRVWKQEYKSEATRLQKNPVPIYFNQ